MCYKLTMAGHHPWSPANWTLALHSPRTLSPPGSVPAPGPHCHSSWAGAWNLLVSLPMCQGSAVLRIVLFHIVGENNQPGKRREAVRVASLHILPLLLDRNSQVSSYLGAFAPATFYPESTSPDTPSKALPLSLHSCVTLPIRTSNHPI